MTPEQWIKWEAETSELALFTRKNYPNMCLGYTEPCVTWAAIQYIAKKESHVCEAVDLAFSEWSDIADVECLLDYVRAIMEHEQLLAGKDSEQSDAVTEKDVRGYG